MDISKKIDRKLNFKNSVHHKIYQLISAIDTFKGSWKILEQSKSNYLKELRKVATIESTGSSTRIEGATLTDQEVEKLLRSVKINKLQKREEQEVVGYYEALEIIIDNYKEIPLSKTYVHQLHSILLKHSEKDQRHKGKYKQLSNKVVANYPYGTQKVIFKTTAPHLTDTEMEQLISWTNHKVKNEALHPLLIISTFVYEFLSIHPYQDGNGRLSRLLTTLLLMKMDYQFIQYVSFEHLIEAKKEDYYRALMEGQKHRYSAKESIDRWTLFFLESLITLTEKLKEKYQKYSRLKVSLNDRQKKIVEFFEINETAQIKDVSQHLHEYSRNTIKKDLGYLVNEGILLRTGAGRGVKYHLKK